MQTLRLLVNGRAAQLDADPSMPLLWALRDHLGLKGIDTLEQLAEVKRVVIEVATDCAVLNADDPLVLKMSGYTEAKNICYVTMNPQHTLVREHIRAVVGRYRGKIKVWDVVNEATHLPDGHNKTRMAEWGKAFGATDYVGKHLRVAREAGRAAASPCP